MIYLTDKDKYKQLDITGYNGFKYQLSILKLFITVLSYCPQIIEYIMIQWSYSFVYTLHYTIIIIMQTFLKVLNFWDAFQVRSVECVTKIRSILSSMSRATYEALYIQLTSFSHNDC